MRVKRRVALCEASSKRILKEEPLNITHYLAALTDERAGIIERVLPIFKSGSLILPSSWNRTAKVLLPSIAGIEKGRGLGGIRGSFPRSLTVTSRFE